MRPFELIKPDNTFIAQEADEPVHLAARSRDRSQPYGPYLVSDELATAANVALWLNQPLLLTGEAGSGKTSFAWALARQLGVGSVLEFHTKSTSTARDLFYSVDTMRRFYDAGVGDERAREPESYITYQALGRAIRSDHTRVVLIDEIDKAPRDFPNDLLRELDQMEFQVQELSPPVTHRATAQHAIVITSNEERRLPEPFLRRCVYHHLPLPDTKMLHRIVTAHLGDARTGPEWIAVAVERFLDLRGHKGLLRTPSTGEMLAWLKILQAQKVTVDTIKATPIDKLAGFQALLKTRHDLEVLRKADA